jgi:hypothetical protein
MGGGGGGCATPPFCVLVSQKRRVRAANGSIARQYPLVVTALHVDSEKKQLIKSKERNLLPVSPFVIIGSTIILLSTNIGKPLPATREKKKRG